MPTGSLKRWTTDRPAGRAAGPCAPQPPARGQVHSVFAGCCNVQLDSQERLLPLLSASLPLQPHGWSVRLPAGSECRDWYRSGMPVTLDAAGLQIGPWPAMECPGQSPAGAFRLPDHGCLSAAGLQLAGRLWAQLWHVPAPASQGWHCQHPWVWPAWLGWLAAAYLRWHHRFIAGLAMGCLSLIAVILAALGKWMEPDMNGFLLLSLIAIGLSVMASRWLQQQRRQHV